MTYIRRERDWEVRAAAEGRPVVPTRLLPVLPPAIAAQVRRPAEQLTSGNGHSPGNGHVPQLAAGGVPGGAGALGPGPGADDHAAHGHG
jgi:hypothetical protein